MVTMAIPDVKISAVFAKYGLH